MSQRAKRPNRFDDGTIPVKRRKRPTAQEEEEASALGWRPINDLKIYNRATTEAPAELFRKDLISAMKLPDSEPLASNEYWLIVDQWKQEWERGVQVPVNPDSLPEPSVTVTHCATVHVKPLQEYKPPKTRYIRITKDDRFKPEEHYLSTAPAQAEAACSYDLDECDVAWLRLLNAERLATGLQPVSEDQLERVIERYELRCWDRIQAILRNEEGLGIEYDENVICDVCRSPDSEEGNEMVFCDACNICVHQACYGITRIPEGQWLCCTCAIKQRPDCVLCPNKGGAMKSTRSGQKWAHVSCALWIPEVSIGCVERMEPITKISSIPASRWALICVLCRERVGSCIQCSVKTCKTAYHVTCAFKHGLEMRAIIEDENADDGVKLRSYCEKHSKSGKKDGGSRAAACSGSEDDDCKRKKRKDMTSEEKNMARAARQAEIEAEFHRHVAVKDVTAACIDVDAEALASIYGYWKLKRRAAHNRPLLPPKYEDVDLLSHKQEQADLERMKMIVQLRQDLERVRNLCYMVSRREKLSRSYFKLRESTFQKQVAVLRCPNLSPKVTDAVVAANRGPSIYDRFYSNADDVSINIESMIARITGCKSPQPDSADERKPEVNGLFKDVKNNPYKKLYFNGSSKRRSASLCSSLSSSEDSTDDKRLPKPRHNKENRLHSSTDDEKPVVKKGLAPLKNSKAERRRKRFSISRAFDSSSEDDVKHVKKEPNASNSRLKQMAKELVGISGSDSDELMPIKTSSPRSSPNKRAMSSIYSDSDSSDSSARNDASDSQSQSKLRTKGAMKDFSHKQLNKSQSPNKSSPENKKKTKDERDKEKDKDKDKEEFTGKIKEKIKKDAKKKDVVPSDLIVPQRQAAKKATENLKSTTITRPKEVPSDADIKPEPEREKDKEKEKTSSSVTTKPKKLGRPPKENKEKDKTPRDKEEKRPKDIKEKPSKEGKDKEERREKEEIFDMDKDLDKTELDILAYVPQRQAAKKAAEHIKGLGNKPLTPGDIVDEKKSDEKPVEKTPKKEERRKEDRPPARVSDKRKSSTNTSSSSSSTSTTSSSSASSSSESDSDRHRKKQPPAECLPKVESAVTSAPVAGGKRSGTKDWPFLDKAAKSAASSTSSSDSSDSDGVPRANKGRTASKSPPARRTSNKSSRKSAADKKSSTTPPEREKPARPRGRPPGRGRPRRSPAAATVTKSNSGDRLATHVRHGDLAECVEQHPRSKARKGKSTDVEEPSHPLSGDDRQRSPAKSVTKQTSSDAGSAADKKGKLFSPVRSVESEKKMRSPAAASKEREPRETREEESEPTDLEKEIMERKVASNKTSKSKFDRMFFDNKEKDKVGKEKVNKSPVKENKEPSGTPYLKQTSTNKKSPSKAVKSLDDIFANKLSNSLNAKSPLPTHEKVISTARHDEDLFKIEEDKSRHNYHQNTHSNDDLLDDIDDIFDNDFGISSKDEDMIKLPLTFNIAGSMLLREDSKEDSARETLNLVEKLRGNMGLTKKSASIDIDDAISVASSKPEDRVDSDQSVPQVLDEKPDEKDLNQLAPSIPPPQINLQVAITKFDEKDYRFARTDAHTEDKSVPDMQQHTDGAALADERWVPPSDYAPHPIETKPALLLLQDDNTRAAKSQSPIAVDRDRRQVARTPFLDAATSLDCMPSPTPYNDLHPQGKWAESNLMPNRRSSSSSVASSASNMSRRNNDDEELPKRHELPTAPGFGHSALDIINNMSNLSNLPNLLPQANLLPFSQNALDPAFQQFSNVANQFVGNPVSLFPPTNASVQLPFPSPGAAMFPPPFGASYPTPLSVMPPLSKPSEEMNIPQTAAFTSSQHNMALTAAMVNMTNAFAQPLKADDDNAKGGMDIVPGVGVMPELPEKEALTAELPVVLQAQTLVPLPEASPALSNSTPNHVQPSPNPSVKSNSSSGKKSPSKPTRTSARFLSQQQAEKKSPGKSPGKSPRQDLKASSTGKKDKKVGKGSSGRGAQSQNRGRGRGRGRGRPPNSSAHHNDFTFDVNTIHNKLVGTVYDLDFDDDMNECGDLRAMRERRKSTDPHDVRKADSPRFTSPSHKTRYHLSELRPPTPISDTQSSLSKPASPEPPVEKAFPTVVPPVMPGPVDMRTYSSTIENSAYQETSLLQFNSTVTPSLELAAAEHEQELEEFDKELRNSLAKQPAEPALPEINKIKVSLSDSRNQLKVKIKGPIANYTSSYISAVTPLPPVSDTPTNVHALYTNSISNAIHNTPVNTNSGVTNFHRMRKKELLRQYCSQGMNTYDPTTPGVSTPVTPSLNRTIITIPKAVASMTSIPTKDDYRDYRTGNDEIFETKIRKDKPKSGLRELRQLDVPFGSIINNTEEENSNERRRSIGSNNGTNPSEKRRGRPPRSASSSVPPGQQTAPKLKIKLGANNVVSSANVEQILGLNDGKIDDRRDRIRPPKKRLSASMAKPSVEDLKRESMKFRKQVMADFSEKSEKSERKEKKKKDKDKDKDKSSRKSKKKKKQDMQVVAPTAADASTTKLIIRLRKNDEVTTAPAPPPPTTTPAADVTKKECANANVIGDNERTEGKVKSDVTEVCANKTAPEVAAVATSDANDDRTSGATASDKIVTPIKLKLARCKEGFVMKAQATAAVGAKQQPEAAPTSPSAATLNLHEATPPPVHAPTPLPLNKDCEVR